MRHLSLMLAAAAATPALILAVPTVAASMKADPAIAKAIANPARPAENRARDQYRHPAETLAFFGVKPGQTVVEFIPSGGWYAEILAPVEASGGTYYALVNGSAKSLENANKLFADKVRFPAATIATYDAAAGTTTVPDGSADIVLTFRNVHNLIMGGGDAAPNMFRAFYRALKPGGTLGVVDHRLPEDKDAAMEMKSGYLKRSTILALATQAGFRLAGESKVNANPKDTHDWPEGVWTLPPTYQLKDRDRAKYAAVGESDRMTLKFVKPKG